MKVLTKELHNNLELQEILSAVTSRAKRTMPVFFLDGNYGGVADSDIKTVKTDLNVSDRENELNYMILPATFTFYNNYYEDAPEREMHSPEEDFLSQYVNRLRIVSYLPEDILKRVKDKRLLACGYAEPNVKNEIIKYTKLKVTTANIVYEKSLEDSLTAASGLTIKEQFENHKYIYSIEELFTEATITGVSKRGKDIYIELDDEDRFILIDAETLEEEINPENADIEMFELHKTEQGYELHFLLKTIDCNLVEHFNYATYRFKNMSFN